MLAQDARDSGQEGGSRCLPGPGAEPLDALFGIEPEGAFHPATVAADRHVERGQPLVDESFHLAPTHRQEVGELGQCYERQRCCWLICRRTDGLGVSDGWHGSRGNDYPRRGSARSTIVQASQPPIPAAVSDDPSRGWIVCERSNNDGKCQEAISAASSVRSVCDKFHKR